MNPMWIEAGSIKMKEVLRQLQPSIRPLADMDQLEVATACTKQLWSNKLATTTYCAVFWTFGLCIGFLGPTLLDLDCQVGETRLGASTWLFFAQTVLMLAGSLMVGFYLTVMTIEMILLQAVICASLALFVIPFCGSIYSLAIILAIMGYQTGLIDAGGNIAMIQLHHKNVQPFLQAMHFFYGLGAFVSPMISAPFLSDGECQPKAVSSNHTFFRLPFSNTSSQDADGQHWEHATQLHWAFWIMACLQIPIIVLLSCLVLCRRRGKAKSNDTYEELEDVGTPSPTTETKEMVERVMSHDPPYKCLAQYRQAEIVFLLMVGFMLFMADGIQGGFADYIASYGKRTMDQLSSADAAHLNATFWGLFTLGRLIAVFLAIWLTPWRIVMMDIIGCGFSLVFLLTFSGSRSFLFICAAGTGGFLGSMAPACLSLAETTVGVTPSATTVMVVMAAMGEIVFPLVAGNLLSMNTLTFPFSLVAAVFTVLMCYIACISLLPSIKRNLP